MKSGKKTMPGKGMYSYSKNPMSVPKKASQEMKSSPIQNADAMKVREMEKRANKMDSQRGR